MEPTQSPARLRRGNTENVKRWPVPDWQEWIAQPLDKHTESLRYRAAQVGEVIGQRLIQLAGKRALPVNDLRNLAIVFGIAVDKATKGEENQGVSLHLPTQLLEGLALRIRPSVIPPTGGDIGYSPDTPPSPVGPITSAPTPTVLPVSTGGRLAMDGCLPDAHDGVPAVRHQTNDPGGHP